MTEHGEQTLRILEAVPPVDPNRYIAGEDLMQVIDREAYTGGRMDVVKYARQNPFDDPEVAAYKRAERQKHIEKDWLPAYREIRQRRGVVPHPRQRRTVGSSSS